MPVPSGKIVVPCGFLASGVLRALALDANDYLKVAFPAASAGLVGEHGYIAGAWQKSPLSFGASGSVSRAFENTGIPTAIYNLDDTAVPAGEMWIITNMAIQYAGTPPTLIAAQIVSGAVVASLYMLRPPIPLQFYDRQGWWVMFPGDFLRCVVYGATVGDDLYMQAWGFRLDTDL